MSPLLTLDVGATNLVVAVSVAGHAEPRAVGSRRFAFAGNERSMIRYELMVVPVVLVNAPPATVAAVRALFVRGAQVPCAGDVFNNGGATIRCSGTVTDELEVGTTAKYWVASLTLYQIAPVRVVATVRETLAATDTQTEPTAKAGTVAETLTATSAEQATGVMGVTTAETLTVTHTQVAP